MIHFISGLPRSGSTLLSAILRQNPRFHAGMTSPAGTMFRQVEIATAGNVETSVFVSDAQRDGLLKNAIIHADVSIAGGLYSGSEISRSVRRLRDAIGGDLLDAREKLVRFDTNRLWCSRLPVLARLFPKAKVIACVRDVAWILDSFERLYRRNGMKASAIYGWDTGGTVFSRTMALASSSGVAGFALDALREACASEEHDRLMLVEYEALCKAPGQTLGRIYDFIGEPMFEHDFGHVEYSAGEFDRQLGARGLHDVFGPVVWKPRETILPPDLFRRFDSDQFWRP